jgi:hypothetical protein
VEGPSSNERQTWTPAGELRVGERVSTAAGDAVIVAVTPVLAPEIVHNLWIGDSHRYRVTDLELDVHNDCWLDKALGAMGRTRDDVPAWMRSHNPHGHHIIPKDMQDLADHRGVMVREMQQWARKHGVDFVHDTRNLAVAPNGLDTHSGIGIFLVHQRLKSASGSKRKFLAELNKIRTEMWNGDFYRSMGYQL